MSVQSIENQRTQTAASAAAYPLPREIDYSCRVPLIILITCSLLWLVVSLLFAVLASVKMHAPGMLADVAALTYGRVAAVSSSTLLYGFLSQAALAATLWLFARMGRTFLIFPTGALVGAVLWNLGVLLGAAGIMAGGLNHFPAYEMPHWTSVIFVAAFVLIGLSALLTFVARAQRDLYPSNWFLFAALFVFPWITAVAYLLLGRYELRGVLEPIISTWFANQFLKLWLAPVALAVLFYFIPKLSQQVLPSYALAVFGFWLYLLAATASGFQHLYAVPNWMPVLSAVVNLAMLLPVAAIAWNWYATWVGHNKAKKQKEPSSRYVVFSAAAFLIATVVTAIASRPSVDQVIGLTIFVNGAATWYLYGFVGMALFAAIYYIVPRLTEIDWPSPRLISVHYGLTAAGIVLVTLALMLGGYVQGSGINTPSMEFVRVSKKVVMYIGINSLGLILLLAAQVALLWHLGQIIRAWCPACCGFGRKGAAQ